MIRLLFCIRLFSVNMIKSLQTTLSAINSSRPCERLRIDSTIFNYFRNIPKSLFHAKSSYCKHTHKYTYISMGRPQNKYSSCVLSVSASSWHPVLFGAVPDWGHLHRGWTSLTHTTRTYEEFTQKNIGIAPFVRIDCEEKLFRVLLPVASLIIFSIYTVWTTLHYVIKIVFLI